MTPGERAIPSRTVCPWRRAGWRSGPEGSSQLRAGRGRQPGQGPLHPFRVPDVHQEQGQDHEGKGRHLEHLGRHAGQRGLEDEAEPLQEGEQVGAEGRAEGVPAAEDGDGKDDPSDAVKARDGSLSSPPSPTGSRWALPDRRMAPPTTV